MARQLHGAEPTQILAWLDLSRWLIGGLTFLCVLTCVGFTVWILRAADVELGGDPALARRALAALADGELGQRLPNCPAGSLMHSLHLLDMALHKTVSQVRQASDSIGVASSEIASGNQDLSARTEQTASNLQQTAASMEELTSTVRNSADSAARPTSWPPAPASEIAVRGGQVVSQVVSTMQEIHHSSQKINDIIGTIDGIAFQTNILALNAAVEAPARASKVVVLRWWPAKCATSRSAALRRPKRSRASLGPAWTRSTWARAWWPMRARP